MRRTRKGRNLEILQQVVIRIFGIRTRDDSEENGRGEVGEESGWERGRRRSGGLLEALAKGRWKFLIGQRKIFPDFKAK